MKRTWAVEWKVKLPDHSVATGLIKADTRTECDKIKQRLHSGILCIQTRVTSVAQHYGGKE